MWARRCGRRPEDPSRDRPAPAARTRDRAGAPTCRGDRRRSTAASRPRESWVKVTSRCSFAQTRSPLRRGPLGPCSPLRRGPLGPCFPAPSGAARALVGYLCKTRAEGRSTMMIETAPSAVHLAANDLPFVDIGGGNKLKVIQVIEKEGLWIIENIFM